MSIFRRLSTIVRAHANKILDKIEDPTLVLNQLIEEMSKELRAAKIQVAHAMANEKMLAAKCNEGERIVQEWTQRAQQAVDQGDDDMAREAIMFKNCHAEIVASMRQQQELQASACKTLREGLVQIEKKLEYARHQKDLLLARSKQAEIAQHLQEIVNNMSDTSAFSDFDVLVERVQHMEHQSNALAELNTNTLEERFKKRFGGTNDKTEEELQTLKTQKASRQ